MKKILSTLLATIMISAVTGCGTVEKTETTSILTEEMLSFIDAIDEKAPVYAEYLTESGNVPVRNGFAYSAELVGAGTEGTVEMDLYMEAVDKVALFTSVNDVSNAIIIKDKTYYIVSDAEEQVVYAELTDEQLDEMTKSMTSSVTPTFNPDTAIFETGTEEYNGTEYLFERITTEEIGEIVVYADTATKEIRYIISAGIPMEITFFDHEVESSVFDIPEDYEYVSMADMNG